MRKRVNADMAANVWKVLVKAGEVAESGTTVVILESMKMEIPVELEVGGVIRTVHVIEGDFVNEGDPIVELDIN